MRLKTHQNLIYLIGFLVSAIITLQACLQSPKSYEEGGFTYPRYNNYVIFKQSFDHLKSNENLYVLYEAEHWDLYKYSPSFALFMAPFFYLPDWLGLFCWNLLNALVLFFALSKISFPSTKWRWLAHAFILPELITSMQNAQSNALIAGMMILGFVYISKNQIAKACLMIILAAFIKPFALVGFLPFLFFPGKFKMVGYALIIAVVVLFAPIIITGFSGLIDQYENWSILLQTDHSISVGYSVLGWLQTWFHLEPNKIFVLLVGLILLLVPLIRISQYQSQKFQLGMMVSVLLWVILFNHRSESPTFIIAAAGIAIWYFADTQPSRVNLALMVFAFVFTCLIATDIFPRFIRKEYAEPYVWKVVPCILIWVKLVWDLVFSGRDESRSIATGGNDR